MKIEIYYRSIIYLGFFIGPKVHPILKKNNNYYELDQINWKVKIFTGTLDNMSKLTQKFFKKERKPKELVEVDETSFLKRIKEFKELNEGKKYHMFNFKTNCIGFKNYILKEKL